ncbi:hypothetical protein QMK38_18110 [Lysinibacillus fusiformis]|nr:hypothetical protein [Lysinibacillus fusiformis]
MAEDAIHGQVKVGELFKGQKYNIRIVPVSYCEIHELSRPLNALNLMCLEFKPVIFFFFCLIKVLEKVLITYLRKNHILK